MDEGIETWLRDFGKAVAALPESQGQDLINEVRGHLADRLATGLTAEQALKGFGAPAAYARTFIEQQALGQALETRNTLGMIKAVAGMARRGLVSILALICVSVCVLLGLSLVALLIVDMCSAPQGQIGHWAYVVTGRSATIFVGRYMLASPAVRIDLGLWIVPIIGLILAALWAIVRWSLQLALRNLVAAQKLARA